MLEHATPKALIFRLKSSLIIYHSEPICKANFYDRASVMQTADAMLRNGEVLCPICLGHFTFHGTYRRQVREGCGKRHDGWVAQVCCTACKKYPALMPSFIMPYKHYTTEVVEAAISESEEDSSLGLSSCPADSSTIQRWINQFQMRGALAVGWLLTILYTVYGQHISTLELQNKGLLKQLARLAKELPNPGAAEVIGNTNIILTRLNYGFL